MINSVFCTWTLPCINVKAPMQCIFPLILVSCLPKCQEMTPEAEIISTRYTKSIIKSCAAMSYIEAQAKMDDR